MIPGFHPRSPRAKRDKNSITLSLWLFPSCLRIDSWVQQTTINIMANSTLSNAKAAKKDEFYTMFYDIETEMEAYLDYNPDVFRGKTVLLPCDDPEWSNFTRYFAQNFEELGLKKLISTSYAIESKVYKTGIQ